MDGISYYAMNQWTVGARGRLTLLRSASGKAPPTTIAKSSPRRHPLHLHPQLVPWARCCEHAVRSGRTRRDAAASRANWWRGRETLPKRRTRPQPLRSGASADRAPALRCLLPRSRGRSSRRSRAAALGRQLGRHRVCTARHFRRLSAGRVKAEMARGARGHALARISTATMGGALQKRFFGHFLKGEDTGGPSSRGVAQHPLSRREIRAAGGERMAARAHPVDETLSCSRMSRSPDTDAPRQRRSPMIRSVMA